MTNDEMKAAIEAVRFYNFHFDGVGRSEEFATVLALAEIGRLALEVRLAIKAHDERPTDARQEAVADAILARKYAADAFLAKHGGGG